MTAASGTHRLSIRIDLAGGARIGPGKVALLEEIGRSGSISSRDYLAALDRMVASPEG